MGDTAWKRTERVVADKLGGKRAGPTGRKGPDVLHASLAPEVKHRKKGTIPKWLQDAVAQAVRNAPDGKLPFVILHEAGQRVDKSLVVVRMDDWLNWFGPAIIDKSKEG